MKLVLFTIIEDSVIHAILYWALLQKLLGYIVIDCNPFVYHLLSTLACHAF